jgi:HK97 gp10 family phage protein
MDIKWEVQGLQELEKAVNNLTIAAGKKVLRQAGREAMAGVQFAMASGAGYDPGTSGAHMRETIKISAKIADSKNGGSDNAVAVRVGPSKQHSQKAIAQEYGTAKQAADPFMRPALFDNREWVVNTFKSALATAIEKAIKKGG